MNNGLPDSHAVLRPATYLSRPRPLGPDSGDGHTYELDVSWGRRTVTVEVRVSAARRAQWGPGEDAVADGIAAALAAVHASLGVNGLLAGLQARVPLGPVARLPPVPARASATPGYVLP